MKGKVCVVTGSATGIGYETALALSNKGAKVLVIARNSDKVENTIKKLKDESKSNDVQGYSIDLSSQRDIRRGVKEILKDNQKIDVLVNNAGTWFSKLVYTEENIETQFAVNHLAYFLLTYLLLPALVKSDDPRIINVGSDSHFQGKIRFNDINLTKRYHGLRAYAQSKLANVMFTYQFERNKTIDKLSIYCVQPGLVKTNIGLKHTISVHGIAWKIRRMGGVTPAEGAQTSIYLASSEEARGISGKYWEKSKPKKSSKRSLIKEDAQRLWLLSEKLCDIEGYFEHVKEHSNIANE